MKTILYLLLGIGLYCSIISGTHIITAILGLILGWNLSEEITKNK